jgi:formylglycine-generating enzyme required for sulfatase activity
MEMIKRFRKRPYLLTALLLLSALLPSAHASEPAPSFPLWDGHESVADYARKVGLPTTKNIDLGGGVKMELVLIPAGKFIMGSPEREKPIVGQAMLAISGLVLLGLIAAVFIRAWKRHTRPQYSLGYLILMTWVAAFCVWGGVRWHEALKPDDAYDDERPAHAVTLTKPYYIGKFTITQEQYQQVMGVNPSDFKGNNLPVETVSWDDAQEFIKKASAVSAQAVRLPSEAEWEFACRAGTSTKFYSGDTEADLERVAWFDANSGNTTHPVGLKVPNKFGLYDMLGNVSQWCLDSYGDYKANEVVDPQGSAQGTDRVLRGGSWVHNPRFCRAADRYRHPCFCDHRFGFRVVVPVSKTP